MIRRFYVGNLNFDMRDEDLYLVAHQYGDVADARVVTTHAKFKGDRIESRGFGFIEMADDAGAERVVQGMHGSTVMGREIYLREAVPRALKLVP